jgi:hypothetical protein
MIAFAGSNGEGRMNRRVILLFLLSVLMFMTLLSFSGPYLFYSGSELRKNGAIVKTSQSDIIMTTDITSKIYHFPVEPLYDAQSMVESRIGAVALSDPELNPFTNCDATVQYELQIIHSTTTVDAGSKAPSTTTTWRLQSMMLQKNGDIRADLNDATGTQEQREEEAASIVPVVIPKTIGGDELYVEWISNTDMGVAFVTDLHDGTYLLEFTRPPAYQYNMTHGIPLVNVGLGNIVPSNISFDDSDESFGRLNIHYHYTCGVAGYYAWEKRNFTHSGDVHETLVHYHIPKPPIQDFVPPNTDGAIDLSKYDVLIPLGDSVIREFYRQTFFRGTCDRPFQFSDCAHALSNHSDALFWIDYFDDTPAGYTARNIDENQTIALITGSAVWDLLTINGPLRPDMTEHLDAIREFITAIRTKYPNMDIYWKATSAIHLHRRDVNLWNNPLNSYLTSHNLNVAQQKLMKELDIPYLDIYDGYYLSAAWTTPGDTIHCAGSTLPTLLLSYFWPGLIDHYGYCNKTMASQHK